MTQRQAIRDFCATYGPRLPPRDRPALREAWSYYLDHLIRTDLVSEARGSRWVGPEKCARRGR